MDFLEQVSGLGDYDLTRIYQAFCGCLSSSWLSGPFLRSLASFAGFDQSLTGWGYRAA